MTQLLQGSGNGASLPYMFLPGNHEVHDRRAPDPACFVCSVYHARHCMDHTLWPVQH